MTIYSYAVRTYFDPNNAVSNEQTALQNLLDSQESQGHTTPTITPDSFQTDIDGTPFVERFFSSTEAAKEYRDHCAQNCSNYIRSVIRPSLSFEGAIVHEAGQPLN